MSTITGIIVTSYMQFAGCLHVHKFLVIIANTTAIVAIYVATLNIHMCMYIRVYITFMYGLIKSSYFITSLYTYSHYKYRGCIQG